MKKSQRQLEGTQDLTCNFTDKAYGRFGNTIRGSIDLGFLRGYQAGYEDAICGKKPKHYARINK